MSANGKTSMLERLCATPVEHHGVRVITLAQMDELHGRPDGTAKRAFTNHKDKLVLGEDYYLLPPGEAGTFNVPTSKYTSGETVLLTETGYLMLVKTFRDQRAWDVQRSLVRLYFAVKAAALAPHDDYFRLQVREMLQSELRGFLTDYRQTQAEAHYSLRDRMEGLGWRSATPKQRDQVRKLALAKLSRHGFPRPVPEGPNPSAELLFPASQCHLVDEAIVIIWEEARYREEGGFLGQGA